MKAIFINSRRMMVFLLIFTFSLTSYAANKDGVVEKALRDPVGIVSGSVNGTYARFAQDISNIMDKNNNDKFRIVAVLGKGSQQNIADLLYFKGIGMAIVQSDVLNFAEEAKIEKNIKEKIVYITKLYNEEVHILARKETKSIKSIMGKKVNIGGVGSGTAMTAKTIFKALDIPIEPTNSPNQEAIARLKSGDIDAAVFVAGKPTSLIEKISKEANLHFLKIDIDKNELGAKGYITSALSYKDYPNMIGEDEVVNTLAVGAVLAVYNFPKNINRYDRLKWFSETLYENLPALKANAGKDKSYHEKWLDVEFKNDLPGWNRFPPVQDLLN